MPLSPTERISLRDSNDLSHIAGQVSPNVAVTTSLLNAIDLLGCSAPLNIVGVVDYGL